MVPIPYKIMRKILAHLAMLQYDPFQLAMFERVKESELLLPHGCKLSKSQFRNRSKYCIKFYHYASEDYLNLKIGMKFLPELPYWHKKFNYNNCMVY